MKGLSDFRTKKVFMNHDTILFEGEIGGGRKEGYCYKFFQAFFIPYLNLKVENYWLERIIV